MEDCLELQPGDRPSAEEVVSRLEEILEAVDEMYQYDRDNEREIMESKIH